WRLKPFPAETYSLIAPGDSFALITPARGHLSERSPFEIKEPVCKRTPTIPFISTGDNSVYLKETIAACGD
ncbi:MAG: hypothetical protein AAFY57_16500, partial [Cyanobacteria bacterium J06642_2]